MFYLDVSLTPPKKGIMSRQLFTITVTRHGTAPKTFALFCHEVTLRGGKTQTVTYFRQVGSTGLQVRDFQVRESPRPTGTVDQLSDIVNALVRTMGYEPEQAVNLVTGIWTEAASLTSPGVQALRAQLRRRLKQ